MLTSFLLDRYQSWLRLPPLNILVLKWARGAGIRHRNIISGEPKSYPFSLPLDYPTSLVTEVWNFFQRFIPLAWYPWFPKARSKKAIKVLWYARDDFIVYMQADSGRRNAMWGVMKGQREQERLELPWKRKLDSCNTQNCPVQKSSALSNASHLSGSPSIHPHWQHWVSPKERLFCGTSGARFPCGMAADIWELSVYLRIHSAVNCYPAKSSKCQACPWYLGNRSCLTVKWEGRGEAEVEWPPGVCTGCSWELQWGMCFCLNLTLPLIAGMTLNKSLCLLLSFFLMAPMSTSP